MRSTKSTTQTHHVPDEPKRTDGDDFARAMELLKEDENMERYYEKKYGHESN